MSTKPKLVVIVGPTGAGKTALGVFLAKEFSARGGPASGWDGEIVSADSRQVYRGMDIGTAKVTDEEMAGVPHHLLDVADPQESFTVTDYKKLAEDVIADIHARGHLPFLVGGSGFYIDAVVYDMDFPAVEPNEPLRAKLEKEAADELFARLQQEDPNRAQHIDPHNKRRLIRALEIVDALGKVPPLKKEECYRTLKLGVEVEDWEAHDMWLLERLKKRLDAGLVAEVTRLHEHEGVSWERLDELGLEYRRVAQYLKKEISYEEMVEKLWIDIRQYARRQMTWFKRDNDIHWVDKKEEVGELVGDFLAI